MSLLLTLISGLFFIVGIVIYNHSKHQKEITLVSMSCASVVIFGLIITDLVPELMEIGKWWFILFVLLGLIVLIIIDKMIPHHHHHHHENDELEPDHQNHLEHIGLVTIIALLLHNMIECMALYSVSSNNLKNGILMLLGISLHNLPLGFQIANYNKDKRNLFWLILLVFSGFIGGLIVCLFGSLSIELEGAIIAITVGMLIHILIFELLKEVLVNIKKKETIYGIIIGGIILVIINLI